MSPRAGVDEQPAAASEPVPAGDSLPDGDSLANRSVIASRSVTGTMGQPLVLLARELRSPIGAIRNAITVMESASKLPEAMEQARCLIAKQVSHLSVLVEDVLDLAKRCSLPAPVRPTAKIVRGGLAAWQSRRVREYIEKNLGQRLTVRDIAHAVGLCPSHFSRAFTRSFGLSAHLYVMHRRVRLAQELMLSTSDALGSIAVSCGMSDQSHLTRWFRRVVGETPNSWRRAHRAAPPAHALQSRAPAE